MRKLCVCIALLTLLSSARVFGDIGEGFLLSADDAYARIPKAYKKEITDLVHVETELQRPAKDGFKFKHHKTLVIFDIDKTLLTSGGSEYCQFLDKKKHFVFWVPPPDDPSSSSSSSSSYSYVDMANTPVAYQEHRGKAQTARADDPLLFIRQTREQVVYFNSRTNHIGNYLWMHATQADASDVIERLKEQADVVALTARYAVAEKLTLRQLQANNISFEDSHFKVHLHKKFVQTVGSPQGLHVNALPRENGISLSLHVDRDLLDGHRYLTDQKPLSYVWPHEDYDWQLLADSGQEFFLLPQEKLLQRRQAKSKNLRPYDRIFSFAPTPAPAISAISYRKGVIHSADNDKGLVMKHLLAAAEGPPYRRILFIDDSKERLVEMYAAFGSDPDIELRLFLYTGATVSPCGYPEHWELALPRALTGA